MCESKVIIVEGGKSKRIIEEAIHLRIDGDTYYISCLDGSSHKLEGYKLKDIDLINHTITFVKK